MKPFLHLKQTKDRSRSISHFGFTFSSPLSHGRNTLENLLAALKSGIQLNPEDKCLATCLDRLMQSDKAAMMINEAAADGWTIEMDDLGSHNFHLDVGDQHIIMNTQGLKPHRLQNSEYFSNMLLISMVRAFRDIWQEKRHGGFEDDYGPENIVMLERMRAADCDTMAIVIAWELKEAGKADIWRHMIGSEEGDMAMIFAKNYEYLSVSNKKDALNKAMQKTFRQWFTSESRINMCDHETLEYLDNLIACEGGNIFGHAYLTPARLEVISYMPDHTAYLQNTGHQLINDPLYTGIADPINQSHFMQIMHDIQAITIGGVSFRSQSLAEKIFPASNTHKIGVDA